MSSTQMFGVKQISGDSIQIQELVTARLPDLPGLSRLDMPSRELNGRAGFCRQAAGRETAVCSSTSSYHC